MLSPSTVNPTQRNTKREEVPTEEPPKAPQRGTAEGEGERIATAACALPRNDRTEESGRQIAAPTESAFAAAEKPKKARKREPETAPNGGG